MAARILFPLRLTSRLGHLEEFRKEQIRESKALPDKLAIKRSTFSFPIESTARVVNSNSRVNDDHGSLLVPYAICEGCPPIGSCLEGGEVQLSHHAGYLRWFVFHNNEKVT